MLPILYQNHDLIIYSYPLLMGLGWGVGYQIFFAKSDIPTKYGQILFWGIFLSAWIGSKLFFYLNTPNVQVSLSETSFWTGGGFVFYGGLIFALLYLGLYKLVMLPLTLQTLWSLLPALTLGHAIGRLGCLLAGCCFGAITDWWWGIELHGSHRHPTQLLESLGLFALALYLLKARHDRLSFASYFMGYGLLRFWIEALRGDEIRGQWGAFTPSQWVSLLLMMTGAFIFYKNFKSLKVSEAK